MSSTLSTYIVTFNCGREICNPNKLSAHLFDALAQPYKAPSILVLALQEVAPLAYAFLGGSYLSAYYAPLRKAVDLAANGLDASYENVVTRNVGMTAIMVFVLQEETAQIRSIQAAGVGLGAYDMGNKGAVAVRLGYSIGESLLEMALVSAHLAPMEDAVDRRNEDWKSIVRGLVFDAHSTSTIKKDPSRQTLQEGSEDETTPLLSSKEHGDTMEKSCGIYTPTSHLFLAGDLNYRTSVAGPLPDEYRAFPQPCEDESYPQHYWHLLGSDQLTRELRAGKTLQGLTEAPIDFPPTYKYSDRARRFAEDAKGDMDADGRYWDWAKHRWPSWCDRVLYEDLPSWMKAADPSAKIVVEGYTALPLMASSDHRPVACSLLIPAQSIPEPGSGANDQKDAIRMKPPFEVDVAWGARRAAARRREVVVGLGAYLSLTWEGRGILLALLCGALGGWAVIHSMIES